jgi:hypothetical protein
MKRPRGVARARYHVAVHRDRDLAARQPERRDEIRHRRSRRELSRIAVHGDGERFRRSAGVRVQLFDLRSASPRCARRSAACGPQAPRQAPRFHRFRSIEATVRSPLGFASLRAAKRRLPVTRLRGQRVPYLGCVACRPLFDLRSASPRCARRSAACGPRAPRKPAAPAARGAQRAIQSALRETDSIQGGWRCQRNGSRLRRERFAATVPAWRKRRLRVSDEPPENERLIASVPAETT